MVNLLNKTVNIRLFYITVILIVCNNYSICTAKDFVNYYIFKDCIQDSEQLQISISQIEEMKIELQQKSNFRHYEALVDFLQNKKSLKDTNTIRTIKLNIKNFEHDNIYAHSIFLMSFCSLTGSIFYSSSKDSFKHLDLTDNELGEVEFIWFDLLGSESLELKSSIFYYTEVDSYLLAELYENDKLLKYLYFGGLYYVDELNDCTTNNHDHNLQINRLLVYLRKQTDRLRCN